jgi:hypothetical protein
MSEFSPFLAAKDYLRRLRIKCEAAGLNADRVTVLRLMLETKEECGFTNAQWVRVAELVDEYADILSDIKVSRPR